MHCVVRHESAVIFAKPLPTIKEQKAKNKARVKLQCCNETPT